MKVIEGHHAGEPEYFINRQGFDFEGLSNRFRKAEETAEPVIIVGAADIYRGRNISAISALLLTGIGLGGAVGPWLGGYIYDVSQSYHTAFIVSMAAFAVGGISYWLAAPRKAEKLRTRLMRPV